ncbi:MAG TPA: YcjX family protein [Acetobacteraceae bacterium]|nr:YcjX family protein [Acetobacteraceae bacterium]
MTLAPASLRAAADRVANETTIRLAVTGLSRAGKTVFLTSLIANLLALGRGRDTLPAVQARLEAGGESRLRGVRIGPAGASTIPLFDFAGRFASLAADPPAWPEPTEGLARIAIDIETDRAGLLARLGRRRLRIEALDYPGEWLLDLPLLGQSFSTWSRLTLERLRTPPRAAVFAEFLAWLAQFDAGRPVSDETLRTGHALYREGLRACRSRLGLRHLQPGRFLTAGPESEAPFLWFFPAPGTPGVADALSLLAERFEAYKQDMRTHFFETHFAAFDRQVVLVDVLGALHAGRAAFEDTARAIADIAAALEYGRNLPPLLRPLQGAIRFGAQLLGLADPVRPRRRIERVAFVATKADHVPAPQREALRALLRALVEAAAPLAMLGEQRISYHAAASVVSTRDGRATVEGRPVEVVMGVKLGEAKERAFYPGAVPAGAPPAGFWSEQFYELPVFAPPRIDPSGASGVPQLGIDAVLASLLADRL